MCNSCIEKMFWKNCELLYPADLIEAMISHIEHSHPCTCSKGKDKKND